MVDSFVSQDDDSCKNMLTERHHYCIVTGFALSTSVICCQKVLMAGSVELHFVSVATVTRLAFIGICYVCVAFDLPGIPVVAGVLGIAICCLLSRLEPSMPLAFKRGDRFGFPVTTDT
jgi:hypothetical protein